MQKQQNKKDLLEKTAMLASRDKVTIGEMASVFGKSSYGVLLLILAVIIILPTGIIPGIAFICATLIIALLIQYIIGLQTIYIPKWLQRKKVSMQLVRSLNAYLEAYEETIERVIQPNRSLYLFNKPFSYLTTLLLASTAVSTVPLTFLPIFEIIPGGIMSLFALGFIFQDGRCILYAWISSSLFLAVFMGIIYFTQTTLL